jgi:hypothetical protein
MDPREDGRLYSRVTRRSKAILEAINQTSFMDFENAAEVVISRNHDDFYLPKYDRPISHDRLRVYFRYLEHIGAASLYKTAIKRTCPMRQSDAQWAQALADMARAALAKTINIGPPTVPSHLITTCKTLMANGIPSTVPNVIRAAIAGDIPRFEYAKWDIYVICDGPNSVLQVRRFPTMWKE